MLERRSRFVHEPDWRPRTFSLYTDLKVLTYLRSTRDGVIISATPGLNMALASFGHTRVLRVGQEHFNLERHEPGELARLLRYYGRLDLFTTLTVGDRDSYRQLLGSRVGVVCMPNGVDRPSGGSPDHDSTVVIAAGRLSRQKSFGSLIRAFVRVSREHPDWELRIFGEGRLRVPLQETIDRLGVGDNVKLMDFTGELDKEMQRSAFLAMSSRYEGLPMVLLEAMALGLPAVSYDCPTGPRDVIETGKNGMLVPAGRQRKLARAILDMIALGPAGRAELGRGALQTADRFSVDSIAATWHQQLTESLADKGVPTTRARLRRVAGLARRSFDIARGSDWGTGT